MLSGALCVRLPRQGHWSHRRRHLRQCRRASVGRQRPGEPRQILCRRSTWIAPRCWCTGVGRRRSTVEASRAVVVFLCVVTAWCAHQYVGDCASMLLGTEHDWARQHVCAQLDASSVMPSVPLYLWRHCRPSPTCSIRNTAGQIRCRCPYLFCACAFDLVVDACLHGRSSSCGIRVQAHIVVSHT